jgi:uncharacterized protein (UPF0332 family)
MPTNSNALGYLAKARESLASAHADFEAGRYNSCANRAYYAAFQAAVAVLTVLGGSPRGDAWEHRFVMSEVSGKLVRRRKLLPARFTGTLHRLMRMRIIADYEPEDTGQRPAASAVAEAVEFTLAVAALIEDRPSR